MHSPVRTPQKDQFNTNWCLSTARKWLSTDDNRQSKVFLVLRVSVDRPESAVDRTITQKLH
ncbi:hypothetical protein Taro_012020 [Colocasia esculenta]|uniref:Uncharacterized protein n=1 Tax=Colocasia esculenta TaxID=4460 RepID=A0A843U7L0_COLES|nr:hypothetical protein [Colocasia esculenta]